MERVYVCVCVCVCVCILEKSKTESNILAYIFNMNNPRILINFTSE